MNKHHQKINGYDPLLQWINGRSLEGDALNYIHRFRDDSTIPSFDASQEHMLRELLHQPPVPLQPPPPNNGRHYPSRFAFLSGLVLLHAYEHDLSHLLAAQTYSRLEKVVHYHHSRLQQENPGFVLSNYAQAFLLELAANHFVRFAESSHIDQQIQGAYENAAHHYLKQAEHLLRERNKPSFSNGHPSLEEVTHAYLHSQGYARKAGINLLSYPYAKKIVECILSSGNAPSISHKST